MPASHSLGFPRLGAARQLKRATDGYWGGRVSRDALLETDAQLRAPPPPAA
jgi:5-methyltetrahydropteroyltriglutamate--homocysteine methyltransferase